MRLFKISTTEYEEEDFFLLTDLTEQDISEVIRPIVIAERDGNEDYDNEIFLEALQLSYPKNNITMIVEFEHLTY